MALAIAVACALGCGEDIPAPAVDAGADAVAAAFDAGDAGDVDADGMPADAALDTRMDATPDAEPRDAAGDGGPDSPLDAADDAAMDADAGADAPVDADSDPFKVVFVTSTVYQASFGGLEEADALCQSLATAAELPGTFHAWLSTRDVTAAERLTHAAVPYVRTDGTAVADDWDDLVDGTLAAPINIDEMGTARTGDVWTGTMADGSRFEPCSRDTCDCELWTDDTTAWVTQCGRSTESNTQWSEQQQVVCSAQLRLYCFQQ